jgi:hypothetical protein
MAKRLTRKISLKRNTAWWGFEKSHINLSGFFQVIGRSPAMPETLK